MAISTSGNSPNVINAAKAANAIDLRVISLTGESGGKLASLSDCPIQAPATETPRSTGITSPDFHHALCQIVENTLFSDHHVG